MNEGPILCVDDEPSNLAVLRQTLKDEHSLVFSPSARDALRAVEKHRPALILLDVEMPEMDGYTLCRHLKNDPKTESIPVIFVTARNQETDEQAGFDAGGVDYITKPFSPSIVRARVRAHLSLVRATALESSYRTAIYMLGEAGHYNDTDTGVHIWRMAAYSRILAEASGWAPEAQKLIELAAPMHDTGKIGIPDAILKKPGKLDASEWEVMQQHSQIGYEILSTGEAPVFKLAAEIALCHHEKWDGEGYPNGLAGEAIPESARIVAVADVFDALSMKRPYKDAWPVDHILEVMAQGAGRHFDPGMFQRFSEALPKVLEVKQHWDEHELRMQQLTH